MKIEKIAKVTKKSEKNARKDATYGMTVDELIEYLKSEYVDKGKGKAKCRANIPGEGWVYLTEINEVLGEVYFGLPGWLAEQMIGWTSTMTKEETKEDTEGKDKDKDKDKGKDKTNKK